MIAGKCCCWFFAACSKTDWPQMQLPCTSNALIGFMGDY